MERITRYDDPAQKQAEENLNAITNAEGRHIARVGSAPIHGHIKRWDKKTADSMDNLEKRMSMTPPAQAWVVNLHPWPVAVNAGRMAKDVCPPAAYEVFEGKGKTRKLCVSSFVTQGQPKGEDIKAIGCGVLLLPWHEIDMVPQEGGNHVAEPIIPIDIAQQYAREGNSSELWGRGIIIYEGDLTPEEAYATNALVPLFNHKGEPITEKYKAKSPVRGSRDTQDVQRERPMLGKFRDLVDQGYKELLANYVRKVKDADAHWQTAEGKEKRWHVTNYTRWMANLLFKLKLIPKLPKWILEDSLDVDAQPESCKQCGTERRGGQIKCHGCNSPYPGCVLDCLRAGFITFEHSSISTLPEAELVEALVIKQAAEDRMAKAVEKANSRGKKT